jgi:hypothetical protein
VLAEHTREFATAARYFADNERERRARVMLESARRLAARSRVAR